MKDLISQIIELKKNKKNKEIAILIENELKGNPNNIELLLRLAIFEMSRHNEDKSINFLKKILSIQKNNIIALLILAYVYEYCELCGMDEKLMNRLNTSTSSDVEISSILKYATSWFYDRTDDIISQEKLLKESIKIYDGHVYNYVDLAKLYIAQGRKEKAKKLIKIALKNVKKVYSENNRNYDPTDYNEFINEGIKGIYLTKPNLEFIEELR